MGLYMTIDLAFVDYTFWSDFTPYSPSMDESCGHFIELMGSFSLSGPHWADEVWGFGGAGENALS